MKLLQKNDDAKFLYLAVYEHFKRQILDHHLQEGTPMPSLRRCAKELGVSRTTIEAAYLQLSADGYIHARQGSGYYVTGLINRGIQPIPSAGIKKSTEPVFDFSSGGSDPKAFQMDLWTRYLKSALRQKERFLYYGEPQGEAELRTALSGYIRRRRNILCTPDEIVVGAGLQNLFQTLCPLLPPQQSVSFPNGDFMHGISVFRDYGFRVNIGSDESQILYVSPAQMTRWGEVMTVKRRMNLLALAAEKGKLLLEDDYENEFIYTGRAAPSLFALDGGKHTVYLGSFSRLFLPSTRIAFMILPPTLLRAYQARIPFLHQTASKAEQIALAQFIQDGHLETQLRRAFRLYRQKLTLFEQTMKTLFPEPGSIACGWSGASLALRLSKPLPTQHLMQAAEKYRLAFTLLPEQTGNGSVLLLSCSAIPLEEIADACSLLHDFITETCQTVR